MNGTTIKTCLLSTCGCFLNFVSRTFCLFSRFYFQSGTVVGQVMQNPQESVCEQVATLFFSGIDDSL
jgi:hypothetical protein